jgi:hypothetical protein
MAVLPAKRRDSLLLKVPRSSFKPSLLTARSRFLLEKISSSATPKFFTAYGDQTVIRIHRSPPLFLMPSQMNPVYALPSY